MTQEAPVTETTVHHPPADSDAHDEHGSDATYVKIAAVLAVITAAEIALPAVADVEGIAVIGAMLAMMVLKFGLVVAYFMHLKYDSILFRRVFVAGLVLAVIVYVIALGTFEFWA